MENKNPYRRKYREKTYIGEVEYNINHPNRVYKSLIKPNKEQCSKCKNRVKYLDTAFIMNKIKFKYKSSACIGSDGSEYPEDITEFCNIEKDDCPFYVKK